MATGRGKVRQAKRRPVRTVTVWIGDPPVAITFDDVGLDDFNDLLAALCGGKDVTIDYTPGAVPPPPGPTINSVTVHA